MGCLSTMNQWFNLARIISFCVHSFMVVILNKNYLFSWIFDIHQLSQKTEFENFRAIIVPLHSQNWIFQWTWLIQNFDISNERLGITVYFFLKFYLLILTLIRYINKNIQRQSSLRPKHLLMSCKLTLKKVEQ